MVQALGVSLVFGKRSAVGGELEIGTTIKV